jgi:epoxyqueuosine reductase
MSTESEIKSLALAQGFDLCGIASLSSPPKHLGRISDWLAKGKAGDMAYLERQKEKRLDPGLVLPGAKSMICVGLIYNTAQPYSLEVPTQAWISRYAWGEDYHVLMLAKLQALEAGMRAALPGDFEMKSYTDTGPISEKAWAAAAGLGWVGKNTNLINQEKGSWFFLGEILTTLDLNQDQPAEDLCGSCRKCLDACPTQAFSAEYELNATRCISYLTIEKRGDIPEEFHNGIGLNLYGCDICQDVCPWNHWKITGNISAFQPRPQNWNPDVERLSNISDEDFALHYNGSSMKRTKAAGLRRNARIVSENLKKK